MPKRKRIPAPRPTVGSILAPLDFSERSIEAVSCAAEIAACFGAPLLLLHVVHDPEAAPGSYSKIKKHKKHLFRMEEAAEAMMSDFLDRARREVPALGELADLETLIVVGLPVTRILEVAERRGVEHIVMGSQGRTGLPHFLLGSKAERVVQLAPVPVTIVKGSSKPQ